MSLKGNVETDRIVEGRVSVLKQIRGYSAYEVAVINGFRGTEEEWLVSLVGIPTAVVEVADPEEGTVNYTVEEILEFVGQGRRVVFRWYLGDSGNFRDYDLLGVTDGTVLFQSKMNSSESEDFTVGMLAVYEGNHFYADQLVINQQAEVELVYDLDGECSLTTEKIYELSCMSKVVVFRDRGEAENEETTSYMLWHADASSAEFRSPVFISDDGEVSVKIVRVTEPNIISREEKVQEKPFYKITTLNGNALTWDGDTEGMTIVNNGDYNLYKISDATPSMEDIKNGGSVRVTLNKPDTGMSWVTTPAASVTSPADGVIDASYVKIVHPEAVNVAIVSNDEVLNGLTFSEAGTYVMQPYVTRVEIPGYTGFTAAVKTLDPVYLPDSAVQTDPAQTANEGDVLTYQDGTPKWAAPERTLDVSFTYDASGSLTCTPGADEVFAAHNAGRTVAAVFENVRFPLDKAGDTVMDFAAAGWLEGAYSMIRLFKDGNAFYYTGKTADEKLDKNQGAANAGKFLGIGTDGMVKPMDAPSGSGGGTPGKEVSFDGDTTGMTWYADNDSDIAFGSSYPDREDWLRIDNAWTEDELLGATVVTKDSSGEHTFTITEDMLNVIEYEDATIIRVGINLFGDNDLVSLNFFNEDGWIPSGLYHYADWPITVTKKGTGGSGGGASSWNDLTDRPVVIEDGDTLTWDGNTEGLEGVDLGTGTALNYHVSNIVPVFSDFSVGGSVVVGGMTFSFAASDVQEPMSGFLMISILMGMAYLLVVPTDNNSDAGITFEKKGIYFPVIEREGPVTSLTIPGYTGFAQEKIAPSHLYQPDWEQADEAAPDFVKNKPFWEKKTGSDTVTWDGNTDGLVSVMDQFFKVSDATPTLADFANGAVVSLISAGTDTPDEVGPDGIAEAGSGVLMVAEGMAVVVHTEGVGVDLGGASFPEPGTYFMGMLEDDIYVGLLTIPGYNGFIKTEIKTLDQKYLPPSLQFGTFEEAGDTLTWDGNTNGIVQVITPDGNYYKVSSAVPTKEDCASGMSYVINGEVVELSGDSVKSEFDTTGFAYIYGKILIVPTDGHWLQYENGDVQVPEQGTYFCINSDGTYCTSLTIPGYTGFVKTEVKTMDPQYLPGDLIPAYTAEDEGKVLKIVGGVPAWVTP